MSDLASIVIPCFNHAHYLPDAVRSVMAQTFTNWEAIIVDDGSTDNTHEVATRFTDPRIRYVYQNNHGLSAARNAGIRVAQGKYLAFLDADDEWEAGFLSLCVQVLAVRPDLAGVYTLCKFFDPDGMTLPRFGGKCVAESEFQARNLEGGFFPIHAALVRADIVWQAGLFDEELTSEEDWDLWIRIGTLSTMACLPIPLACYRVYPGSMSTNAERMVSNAVAVLTKYFGPPAGSPLAWDSEKRRTYGFAYRGAAFRFIQQRQVAKGWRYFTDAVALWPPLLARLDTFYELALGDQPFGYRGHTQLLDIATNAAEIPSRLDEMFCSADESVLKLRGAAYGNTYLALCMLADQAGDWDAARRYLLRSVRYNPGLLSISLLRRLFKLSLGPSAVRRLRSFTSTRNHHPPQGAAQD